MFEMQLLAAGFVDGDATAVRKAALLKASLGIEGYRIYKTLTDDVNEKYDLARTKLAKQFDRQPNIYFLRAQFTCRVQSSAESVTQFITALRELAGKCDFGDQLDSMLLNQFVAWLRETRIRERLFQEERGRSLQQMLDLALTVEQSFTDAAAMASGHTPAAISDSVGTHKQTAVKVERLQAGAPNFKAKSYSGKSTKGRGLDGKTAGERTCYCCGKPGHLARSADCPARDKECLNCHKPGHFAAVCRYGKPVASSKPSSTHRVANKVVTNAVMVSALSGEPKTSLERVQCVIDDQETTLLLDVGSQVSVLAYADYKSKFSTHKLRETDVRLSGYGGKHIQCYGYMEVPVR